MSRSNKTTPGIAPVRVSTYTRAPTRPAKSIAKTMPAPPSKFTLKKPS